MAKTRNGRSQLAKLASAHRPSPRLQTPRKEDYVEIIYELIREKGFAKPVDIANHLHVTPPTVTGMLDGLPREGLIVQEKYGGIAVTETIGEQHALLVNFLRLFGVQEATAQKDTEGLEHYVAPGTLEQLARLIDYVKANPDWWSQFKKQSKA